MKVNSKMQVMTDVKKFCCRNIAHEGRGQTRTGSHWGLNFPRNRLGGSSWKKLDMSFTFIGKRQSGKTWIGEKVTCKEVISILSLRE